MTVWIAVAVLAVVVLGTLAYGLVGALKRLTGELSALDRELEPVLTEVRATAARAGDTRSSP